MNTKKYSNKQEKQVAKDINGKTTIASGALYFQKADVRNDKFLIECKTTSKGYFNITLALWEKIYKEAIKDGLRIPIMCIELNNKSFKPTKIAVFIDDYLGYLHDKHFPENSFMGIEAVNSQKCFRIKSSLGIVNLKDKYTLAYCPWENFLEFADEV